MNKFKPALATNLHADNFSPMSNGFAVGFDYEGARYHIWFRDGRDQEILYKNPPLSAKRGDANHFDTRKLDLGKPFGLAVLQWIEGHFAVLTNEAREKHDAECAAARASGQARIAAARVRDAAPEMAIALQECRAEITRLNKAYGETVFNPAATQMADSALASAGL